jgi:hypothetical protein
VLLVCGRSAEPVSEAEVREVWGNAAWSHALKPSRLLRLQANHVKDEGDKSRDFGAEHAHPEPDPIVRRLDGLRERLALKYSFFEGLAFRHD